MNLADKHPDNDAETEVAAIRRICKDPIARRELLWLRAHEKEDQESIDILERTDPTLRARMARLVRERRLDRLVPGRERREAFGRLWDERFEHWSSL